MMKEFSDFFSAFAKWSGMKETEKTKITFIISIIALVIAFINIAYKQLKKVVRYYWRRKTNRDLHPYFIPSDVRNATKYYIPTRFQNVSPTEDEEPGRRHIASAKNELMPLFLKSILSKDIGDNKYYLILADSGMGKTTFLINLFIQYKNKFRTIFQKKPFSIYLIPIWHTDANNAIKQIKDPENSILLLDAFDESIQAQKDYFRTLKNLLLRVSRFRVVVLTCRTQFFPSQKDEPYETGYFTAGERGEFKFQKLYISVFSDKDVNKYIGMRFNYFWQGTNHRKAMEIARKCPNLVIRPMLLAHIKELIETDKVLEFSFQVYEEFINSWIRRESRKIGIKEKYQSEIRFIKLLILFSEKFAVNLYQNREIRNGYYIPKGEEFQEGILTAKDLLNENNEDKLDENDGRSKSLLTRNAVGDIKFSHKSIMEYFIAKAFFKNQLDFYSFSFIGMDMASRFHKEMLFNKIKKQNGYFSYSSAPLQRKELKFLQFENIRNVNMLILEDFYSLQPAQLSVFTGLEILVLIDTRYMQDVYLLYHELNLFFMHLNESIEMQRIPVGGRKLWSEKFVELDKHGLTELKKHLQGLGYEKVKKLYNILCLDQNIENVIHFSSLESGKDRAPVAWKLDGLERGNEVIKKILPLMKLLPDCEIYF